MDALDREIAAYERMLGQLEREHMGKWVVFHGERLAGSFDTFEEAGEDAAHRFGRGPYLIRQVGAPPYRLPSSLLHRTFAGRVH